MLLTGTKIIVFYINISALVTYPSLSHKLVITGCLSLLLTQVLGMGGPNRTCSTGCRPRLALALLGQPTKTEAFADLAALSSPIQQPTPPILVQLPVKKREAQVQVRLFFVIPFI